jgi:O-antigen ligase
MLRLCYLRPLTRTLFCSLMSATVPLSSVPSAGVPPQTPSGWWATLRALQQRNELARPAFLIALGIYIVALFTARRALISLAPLALLAAALLNHDRKLHWRAYCRNPVALVPLALYGWLLLSGFITEDFSEWRHQLFRQLLLLAVPLAVALAPPLAGRHRAALGAGWLGAGVLVAGATLVHYFRHRAAIEESFSRSKNLAAITGVGHIYFGVMLAVAALYGLELAMGRAGNWHPRYRLAAAVGGGVCVGTMHLLAYRTGLLALYVALGVSGLRLLVVRRRYVLGVLLLLCVAVAPIAAYHTMEGVRRRVAQTQDDLLRFQTGQDINDYSLSQRLAAWATAGELVRTHWLLGVGSGDVPLEMKRQYERRSFGLVLENQKLPHNQYLHHLLGGGVVALVLLLLLFILPLATGPAYQDPCLRHFLIAYGAALCFDSMFEVQYGFNPFMLNYAILVVGPWQRRIVAKLQDSAASQTRNPSFSSAV